MKYYILWFMILLLFAIVCSGCSFSNYKSTFEFEAAESFFEEHETDLQILADYLKNQEYKTIYINKSNGTALADLESINIEDESVIFSIEHIMQDGCKSISKNTDRNCVQFILWSRNRDEADGGLLFSLNGREAPKAQFQTEQMLINQDGWYYYLAEYNKWRINRG